MAIPKQFNIFGHTIKVKYVKDLQKNQDCYGKWDNDTLTISLQCPTTATTQKTLQEQTFYHELAHAICDLTGYPELSKDEQFIDLFGSGLHQVQVTQKF